MAEHTHEAHDFHNHSPRFLVGLICSSCGLGFTSEEELRDHQVICRSSAEFLSQFTAPATRREELN
jgi:hypothetical protein